MTLTPNSGAKIHFFLADMQEIVAFLCWILQLERPVLY